MGKGLFCSTTLAFFIELILIPVAQKVSVDGRWSPLTFLGAVLFISAAANLIHRSERLPEWLTSVHVSLISLH